MNGNNSPAKKCAYNKTLSPASPQGPSTLFVFCISHAAMDREAISTSAPEPDFGQRQQGPSVTTQAAGGTKD